MDQSTLEGVAGAGQEGLTADAALQELRNRRGAGEDAACRNCGTELVGPHCHRCGQLADGFHRPLWNLLGEGLEGLFALDGRFWRTVPPLLYSPKRVTAEYLAGARVRFVAPFRLFLFASLVFFIAFGAATSNMTAEEAFDLGNTVEAGAPAADAAAGAAPPAEGIGFAIDIGPATPAPDPTTETAEDAQARAEALRRAREDAKCQVRAALLHETPDTPACARARAAAAAEGRNWWQDTITGVEGWPRGVRERLATSVEVTIDRPDAYFSAVKRLFPRVAFFMFPLLAVILALLHVWRRDLYLYDYTIASLHYHAALFVVLLIALGIGAIVGAGWALLAVVLWAQVWLYRLHRDVFRDSRLGSALRVVILDVLGLGVSTAALIVLLAAGLWTL